MKLLLLTFVTLSTLCSAQKKYSFDYYIEYEKTWSNLKKDSVKQQIVYLTNSKNNNYFAKIKAIDNLNLLITLRVHDKLYAKKKIKKSEFVKSKIINFSYSNRHKNINRHKSATKRYDFFSLKDTLYNNKQCDVYILKSLLKQKKRIRKGAGNNIYYVDRSTKFHLPILIHPTAYEEWKLEKNIPNGIYLEKKHFSPTGEEFSSEKLVSKIIIKKQIVFTE